MRGGLGGINLVEEPHSSSLASSTYDHMTRDHVTIPRRGAIMSTLSGYQGVRRTFASPTGVVTKFCVFKSSIMMGSRMIAAGMGSSIESYIIGRMYIDAFNTNYCTSGITWSGLNLHGVRLR